MNVETTSVLVQALTHALRRLAHWAHSRSWDLWHARHLTPTQRRVIALLASRGESLSITGVARELGLSAATISETLKVLTQKGLVSKHCNSGDRRSRTPVLTVAGQELTKELAERPDPLRRAFDELSTNEQESLYRLVIKLIHGLEERGALPMSRMCVRCRSFDPFRNLGSHTPHHCHRAGTPLAESQLRIDCEIFGAGDASAQSEIWRKFIVGV